MGTLRTIVNLAVSTAVVISAVLFALANPATIDVDYVVGEVSDVATWKALAAAAALGAGIVGALLGVAWALARLETRRQRKAVAALESELRALRALPPGEPDSNELAEETRARSGAGAERSR